MQNLGLLGVAGPSIVVWTLMLPVICCGSCEVYVGIRWWWWWWWCLSSHSPHL